MQDLHYYLGFNLVNGIGPTRLDRLIAYFGSLEDAWNGHTGDLALAGLDGRSIDALLEVRRIRDLEAEYERVVAAGVRLISRDDPSYPALLRGIPASPPLLYVRGTLTENDRWAVAVVGTRNRSTYGRDATRKLVSDLVAASVTIVSGLALGIDAVAHEAALAAGGRTLAVLGSGVDQIYPATNRRLGEAVLHQGAIISEYPLGTIPVAANFPARNRIISGLALGVLVVEAGVKSGALITVKFALEQGRDVFAVPGPITSRVSEGTNNLLKLGAKCVTSARDILEELKMDMVSEHVEAARSLPADPTERMLLDFLQDSSQHIDDLTNKSGLPASTVSAVLTMMELKGMVRHIGGMQYAAR